MVCYSSSSEEDVAETFAYSHDPENAPVSPSSQKQHNEGDNIFEWEIVDEWHPTKDNLF